MFKGKDRISSMAVLCMAFCLLPQLSLALSCQQVFTQQDSEYISFDEFLETGASTKRIYEDLGQGRGIGGLYDAFLTEVKYQDVPALAIGESLMSRFNFRPPQSQESVELKPSLEGVRDRAFGVLPAKEIELPMVQIKRISDLPVQNAQDFLAAELSSGQVVLVSKPLSSDRSGGQLRAHYRETELILYELYRVGLIPFLAIGQDSGGALRLVRPVFRQHGELLIDFNVHHIYRRLDREILPRLAQLDLPWFKQYFSPDVARSVAHEVLQNIVLGDISQRADLGIVDLINGGRRPWRIMTDSGGTLTVAPQGRSADHFIGVVDLIRASIISELPAQTKKSLVKKAYLQGDLDKVFMTIYLDLLLGIRPSNSVNWRNSEFRARVDAEASILVEQWVSGPSLKYHFKKHGRDEMGLQTREEYLQMAREFFADSEASAILLKRLGTGGFFKYNFETREFGVLDADLRIVTYFQLDTAHQNGIDFHRYLAEQIGR